MSSNKENTRTCCKCRSSTAKDPSITLYRFPNPGPKNSLRCELWAKYCFPNEAWSSPKFQKELYTKHKMLCRIAKWNHIKMFFELGNSNAHFVYAPCLREEHLNSNSKQKMKVKLAAQILSHSVAAGIYSKIANGDMPSEAIATANLIAKMDMLFDSVNASTSDLRRGKKYTTNIKESTTYNPFPRYKKSF